MSGLVASGAVMVLYTAINWWLGRIAGLRYRMYRPPTWWRVWLLCALPLAIGIPAITMTVNWPTLPPANAAACTAATLVGLALALSPGSLAAQRPSELGWLVFCGMGLVPCLLLLRAVELPGRGLISATTARLLAVGGTSAGMVWLSVVSWLRAWRCKSRIEPGPLFLAGLGLSYLLMPLLHYLLLTPPGFRYISASSNFFAFHPGIQFASLLMTVFLAYVTAWLQQKWQRQRCSRSCT